MKRIANLTTVAAVATAMLSMSAPAAFASHEHYMLTPGTCVEDVASGQTQKGPGEGGYHKFHENVHLGTPGMMAFENEGNPVAVYKSGTGPRLPDRVKRRDGDPDVACTSGSRKPKKGINVQSLSNPIARLGGLAAVAGGLLWSAKFFYDRNDAPPWPTDDLFFVVLLLSLIGLVGLYVRLRGHLREWEAVSLMGFVASIFGLIASVVGQLTMVFEVGPSWWYGMSWWLFVFGYFVTNLSLAFIGNSILQSGALPRWRALPLTIGLLGILLILVADPPNSELGVYPSLVLWITYGLGWAVLGYVLWPDEVEDRRRRIRPNQHGVDPTRPLHAAEVLAMNRFSVPVGDQERAKSFYVDTLGLELLVDDTWRQGVRWSEVAPTRTPGDKQAMFRDPFGNPLTLWEHAPAWIQDVPNEGQAFGQAEGGARTS